MGAIKPNIGHSEGASGIISLMKVLLMMKHGKITPQAHFKTLNPEIPALEPDMLAISRSLKEWRDDSRLALVNSYGASGNNAAAVVAPPPNQPTTEVLKETATTWPIFVSAASKESLLAYCEKLRVQLENPVAPKLVQSIAFALATKQNRRLPHVFSASTTSCKITPRWYRIARSND